MYNVKVLSCVLLYYFLFFGLNNYEHYRVTQLQDVFLGILGVRQQPLKESVAKAVGYGWKVHLHCLPIPVEEVKSNQDNDTRLLEKTASANLNYCIIWTMYFISGIT